MTVVRQSVVYVGEQVANARRIKLGNWFHGDSVRGVQLERVKNFRLQRFREGLILIFDLHPRVRLAPELVDSP